MRGSTINWKAYAITVVSVLLVLAILLGQSPSDVVTLSHPVPAAFELDRKGSRTSAFINHQVFPKLALSLELKGQAQVTVGQKKFQLGPTSPLCKPAEAGFHACRMVVKTSTKESPLLFSSNKGASIQYFQWTLVKFKRQSTLSGTLFEPGAMGWLAGGMGGLLLFVLLAHQSPGLSQWGLIGAAVLFLYLNDGIFTGILLVYLLALYLLRHQVNDGRGGLGRLFVLVVSAIAFLLLFKYGKAGIYGVFADPGGFNLLMPVGISYFIIRLVDTLLRWFRGQNREVTLREFFCFILFPGTLVAGPVENIRDFYQKRLTKITADDYAYGLSRIFLGLFKKVVIADAFLYKVMAGGSFMSWMWGDKTHNLVNHLIFDPQGASLDKIAAFALVGLLFAYIDFSSYSDMAIGFSRLLGFRIRENFNWPILAANLRDYWKRWHISLSDWAFQNIFFPLMIQIRSPYPPLFVTMLTIGLWHAFNLSWFSWAIHHGIGMTLVAWLQKHLKTPKAVLFWLRPVRTALTLQFASMGFLFVYFNDYAIAATLYSRYWLGIFELLTPF
ncbi:MAG: hypothetical protein HQL52_09525 [Magnetococcales bacterium]|nr:hypothetical protein [Magnetococcales bacterium]